MIETLEETSNETKGEAMTTGTRQTFPTRVDIPLDAREALVELLNARLADAFDLYSQLKQAHWNVKGSDFIQLHALYDTVAADVIDHVDMIAERRPRSAASLSAPHAWPPSPPRSTTIPSRQ